MTVSVQWPYRQDDREWKNDVMWDRAKVVSVHQRFNGGSEDEAKGLLREFKDGNTIGNEGCQITCLAMVLRLLASRGRQWTPKKLNKFAQKQRYYTRSGLAMTPLYADLVLEASKGEVQLLLKEEYLPGEAGWPKNFASMCLPVRAYRTLPPNERKNIAIVLKTGTYDDTIASHFVVLDPDVSEEVNEDDIPILDPAQPCKSTKRPWLLSDSARQIKEDKEIAAAWRRRGIKPLQLGGVWVFARWVSANQELLGEAFLRSLVS